MSGIFILLVKILLTKYLLTIEGGLPSELPKGSVIFPFYESRDRDLKNTTQAPWWQLLTPQ